MAVISEGHVPICVGRHGLQFFQKALSAAWIYQAVLEGAVFVISKRRDSPYQRRLGWVFKVAKQASKAATVQAAKAHRTVLYARRGMAIEYQVPPL